MCFVCKSFRSSTWESEILLVRALLLHLMAGNLQLGSFFKSVCLSATEAHRGERDVFVSFRVLLFFFTVLKLDCWDFLSATLWWGSRVEKVLPNEISSCFSPRLGASRALLSSSGGLITVFVNRRTSHSHLKQIPACLIPQHCTDEMIWGQNKKNHLKKKCLTLRWWEMEACCVYRHFAGFNCWKNEDQVRMMQALKQE